MRRHQIIYIYQQNTHKSVMFVLLCSCVHLLAALSQQRSCVEKVSTLLPVVADATRHKEYSQHYNFLETVLKQVSDTCLTRACTCSYPRPMIGYFKLYMYVASHLIYYKPILKPHLKKLLLLAVLKPHYQSTMVVLTKYLNAWLLAIQRMYSVCKKIGGRVIKFTQVFTK